MPRIGYQIRGIRCHRCGVYGEKWIKDQRGKLVLVNRLGEKHQCKALEPTFERFEKGYRGNGDRKGA